MKYYYLYEIQVLDESSTLYNHVYYGKHITSNLNTDTYFGSGHILNKYIKKHGKNKLKKTILGFYQSENELNNAEKHLIDKKKKTLGKYCLNLNNGGHGSFSYINNVICKNYTEEQRHNISLRGGLANKERLKDPVNRNEFVKKCIQIHANLTPEEKLARYQKVSKGLIDYYKTDQYLKIKDDKLNKNIESNKQTSKRWRTEFYSLFKTTPESFRKYGKLAEVLQVFKRVKTLTNNKDITDEITRFMESLNH